MSPSKSSKSRRSQAPSAPQLPEPLQLALQAVRSQPLEDQLWDDLDEIARELDRPEEVGELYQEVLSQEGPLEAWVEIGRRAVNFGEEWFDEPDFTLRALERVLQLDPQQAWAFERLTVLLTADSRWEDLLSVYDRSIEAAQSEEERAELLTEAARVARDFAGQIERGTDYQKALFLLRPQDEQLAVSLEKRLDEQGRHADLVQVWRARLQVQQPEAALHTRALLAERLFRSLGEAESAFQVILEYLQLGGQEPSILPLLEQLAAEESVSLAVRKQALQILESLHEAAGRQEEWVLVVEQSLLLAETEEEQRVFRKKAVTLLEALQRREEALVHAVELFVLEPEVESSRAEAQRLARSVGQMESYALALVRGAEAKGAVELRVELLLEAASLYRAELGDAQKAEHYFSLVLAEQEAASPARLQAARELSSLLQLEGQEEKLLSVLLQRVELSEDEEERWQVLAEAARLAQSLAQLELALDLWTQRLSLRPQDERSLSEKIAILQGLSRHEELVEHILLRAGVRVDEELIREDLVSAAQIYAVHLQKLPEAISTWRELEGKLGRSSESLEALITLSEQADLYEDVASLLREALAVEEDPERALAQWAHLGDVLAVHLQKPEQAIEAYRQSLTIQADSVRAQAGLRELLTQEEVAGAAAETLADAFRRAEQPELLLELLETRLTHARSDAERTQMLLEAARLEEEAGNTPSALLAASRAFSLSLEPEIEQQAHRLAASAGDYTTLVSAYQRALERAEGQRAGELHYAQGQIWETQLGRFAGASAAYKEALRIAPREAEVARAFLRTALQAELFSDAVEAVLTHGEAGSALDETVLAEWESFAFEGSRGERALRELESALDAREGAPQVWEHELRKQLAVWYEASLQDERSAERVLRRAVELQVDEDTLGRLAAIQRRRPSLALVTTLKLWSELRQVDLHLLQEAAQVAWELGARKEDAAPLLQEIWQVGSQRLAAPGQETEARAELISVTTWGLEKLLELAEAEGETLTFVELLERAAGLPLSQDAQIQFLFRAARAAERFGQTERAMELALAVLEKEESHEESIALLGELYHRTERHEELYELRARELRWSGSLERRLFLRLDQVRLLGLLEREVELRLTTLRENLEEFPGHAATLHEIALLFEEEQRFEEWVDLWEEEAQKIASSDPVSAARLWEQAGRLAEEHFEDRERLQRDFQVAVSLVPQAELYDRLALLSHEQQDHEKEALWLESLLGNTPPESQTVRRDVVERLARSLLASEERSAARVLLEKELRQDAAAQGLRALLAERYEEEEQWAPWVQTLAEGVPFAESDEERVALLSQAAHISRQQLHDLEQAIPFLEAAIELRPEDRVLRLQLADALRLSGQGQRAQEILQALLEEFGRRRTKERAVVHEQLARILQEQGAYAEALEQAEAAASIERTDPKMILLVGHLARQNGNLERAEQAYRTLLLLVGRKGATQTADATRVGESTILYELSRIAAEEGNAERAAELLDSALEVATKSSEEALLLDAELSQTEQSGLLLQRLEERLQLSTEREDQAELLLTQAQIIQRSGQVERALQMRLQAIELVPTQVRFIDSTWSWAQKQGVLLQLMQHLEQLAQRYQEELPDLSGELWMRLGSEVQEIDGERAAQFFERAQLTNYKPRRVFLALDQVLQQLGDPARVVESLRRFVALEAATAYPQLLADAKYRLAEYELKRGELDSGLQHLTQALDLDAKEERALELLLGTVSQFPHAYQAAPLLLRLARQSGNRDHLLTALQLSIQSPDVALSLIQEAVTLTRELGTAEALEAALDLAIERAREQDLLEEVREELVERAALFQQEGRYARAAQLLGDALPWYESERAWELGVERAELLAQIPEQQEEARAAYGELFERSPQERRIWQPLFLLSRQLGREEDIHAHLKQIDASQLSEEDQEFLQMEQVRLLLAAERFEEAEAVLRQALTEHPEFAEAADILAELFKQQGRLEELREHWEQLFDQARSRDDAAQVRRTVLLLADLLRDTDPEEAASLLTASLTWTSGDRSVLQLLRSLQTEETPFEDRAEVLEYLLAVEEGEAAVQLALHLAEERLAHQDEEGAARAWELGFRAAPTDPRIGEKYVNSLFAQEDYLHASEALLFLAEQESTEEGAAQAFARAAQLFEEQLGDPESAARAFLRAFEKQAYELTYLERAVWNLAAVGEAERALEVLSTALEDADEITQADLFQLRAKLIVQEFESDVQWLNRASQDLRHASGLFITEEQAQQMQQDRELILQRLFDLYQGEESEAEGQAVCLELGQLALARGEAGRALEIWESWLQTHEQDRRIAQELTQLALQTQSFDLALYAARLLLEASSEAESAVAALLLADAAEGAGLPLEAKEPLLDAMRLHPQNEQLSQRLRALYEAAGAQAELAELLLEESRSAATALQREELLRSAGDLLFQAGESQRAIEILEEARSLSEEPTGLLVQLTDCYLELGEVERARQMLTEAIEAQGRRRSPELSQLQHALARVARLSGDVEEMYTLLDAALMSDRNNSEVAVELALRAEEDGRYEMAVKALQMITLSKGSCSMSKAESYYRQAVIAEIQGDGKRALLLGKRALTTEEGFPQAQSLVDRLGG